MSGLGILFETLQCGCAGSENRVVLWPSARKSNFREPQVRLLRRRCGKTQQVFATELGMSLRAYQKYEHDQMPEPRALLRFWAFCGDRVGGENLDVIHAFNDGLARQLQRPEGWTVKIE